VKRLPVKKEGEKNGVIMKQRWSAAVEGAAEPSEGQSGHLQGDPSK